MFFVYVSPEEARQNIIQRIIDTTGFTRSYALGCLFLLETTWYTIRGFDSIKSSLIQWMKATSSIDLIELLNRFAALPLVIATNQYHRLQSGEELRI
jgi:hypothetical protein